ITYWKKLSYDKLVKELSYKKKCKYTDRTLRGILKSLIDKGHIEEKDGVYTTKRKRAYDEAEDIGVYSAILKNCVQGVVTEEETQFYCYLKGKYIEQYRLSLASKQYFYIDVLEVAKEIGKGETTVRDYISNLIDKAVMSKCENKKIGKNGAYNEYRLHF
ncbi:MAG: hypothetical protein MSH12_12755, partial [Romboutsia timonensis]|nr:hypothetical protein [Romboutsia timonensis]